MEIVKQKYNSNSSGFVFFLFLWLKLLVWWCFHKLRVHRKFLISMKLKYLNFLLFLWSFLFMWIWCRNSQIVMVLEAPLVKKPPIFLWKCQIVIQTLSWATGCSPWVFFWGHLNILPSVSLYCISIELVMIVWLRMVGNFPFYGIRWAVIIRQDWFLLVLFYLSPENCCGLHLQSVFSVELAWIVLLISMF